MNVRSILRWATDVVATLFDFSALWVLNGASPYLVGRHGSVSLIPRIQLPAISVHPRFGRSVWTGSCAVALLTTLPSRDTVKRVQHRRQSLSPSDEPPSR